MKKRVSKVKMYSRGHKYSGSGVCTICWPGQTKKKTSSMDVDQYIAKAPKALQSKLKELRKAITQIAPDAEESISYKMPYYSYKGRLAWFALMKNHIGLYVRPPIIAEHERELTAYKTTKSAIHFPVDEKLPIALIKKLVRASIKKNEEKK